MGSGNGKEATPVLLCRARRRQYRSLIYALTILLILALSSIVVIGKEVDWADRVINEDLMPSYTPVLESDAENRIHVVYSNEWGGVPRHATLAEGEWQEELIELEGEVRRQVESIFNNWEIMCPLLALDPSGDIWLGYRFPDSNRTLGVIEETGNGFEFHVVDSDVCNRMNGMAIDSDGRTHLVYSVHEHDTLNVTIKHAIVGEGSTSRRVITEAHYSEDDYLSDDYFDIHDRYDCRMVMDSAGEPVAVVYDGAEGKIWCYSNLTGDIRPEIITSEVAEGGCGLSLLTEDMGRLHAFWLSAEIDEVCMSLGHAVREDSRWTSASHKTDIDAQVASIDVVGPDPEGAFRAFVRDYSPNRILSLQQSDDIWLSEVVRSEPQFTSTTSYQDLQLNSWSWGPIRAVRDVNGDFIVSKPYGHPGVVTDNVTITDRLREATGTMLIFTLIAAPVALLCIPVGKGERRECLWVKVLRKRRKS